MAKSNGQLRKLVGVVLGLCCGCLALVSWRGFEGDSTSEVVVASVSHVRLVSADKTLAADAISETSSWCDFSVRKGRWTKIGSVADGEGSEHILHWSPVDASCGDRSYRRFSQDDAFQCLKGKRILMYGNSNTRTLYIALEALLRGSKMTSRVAAKQLCDNSRANHSCWTQIVGPRNANDTVVMHYVSYVDDLFHDKLPKRLMEIPFVASGHVDLVVGNSGLNVIQLQDDKVFLRAHRENAPKLKNFVESFFGGATTFVWHKTTPVCPNQPHFRRYRYNAKHWRYRTLEQINHAVTMSNAVVAGALVPSKPRLLVLDDWSMIRNQQPGETVMDLCPFFEDPLHHRFLDREVIQVMLNEICP